MNDEPSSTPPASPEASLEAQPTSRREKSFLKSMTDWLSGHNGETARDALEELIEEPEDGEASLGVNERQLLSNILDLHDQTVADVMVPRADIIAAKADVGLEDLIQLITEEGHSRVPLYRNSLDDAFGLVHVKDVLAWRGQDDAFDAATIARPSLFVSPSMHVLELLLEMRAKRVHMAFVVDEFGGVDGLVTIEDLVEEIVGEIEDEFDQDDEQTLQKGSDGTWVAPARTLLDDFEAAIGQPVFDAEEHDDVDTLGGLVFTIAGRVPTRGELLTHPSGLEFEILDADPRRIKRVRVRVPASLGGTDNAHIDNDAKGETWDGVDWAQDLLRDDAQPITPANEDAPTLGATEASDSAKDHVKKG